MTYYCEECGDKIEGQEYLCSVCGDLLCGPCANCDSDHAMKHLADEEFKEALEL